MNGYWAGHPSAIPLQPPVSSSSHSRFVLQPPPFTDPWQGSRATASGPSYIPLSPMPFGLTPMGHSYHDAVQAPSSRLRSRSAGLPPTYHSIRSSSPNYHSHSPSLVHSKSDSSHGKLSVRLTKAPSLDPQDSRTFGAVIEVNVGPEKHRVPFPEPKVPWDHLFSFTPVVMPKNGHLICAENLNIILWEAENAGGQVARDRARLDLSHLTCGCPSVFVIDLCGQTGFTLEAIALDFGEPQLRPSLRQAESDAVDPGSVAVVNSGIGKLKIAMLRQMGFPPGKQIAIELTIGSKKITTNICSTGKEQLGDKFTFFVKLRATPLPGVQIACNPLVLRVLEDGTTLLGAATLELTETMEQQITRHKVEVQDEQGNAIGQVELALKPINFGRKSSKYRPNLSPGRSQGPNASITSTTSGSSTSTAGNGNAADPDIHTNIRELQAQLVRMKHDTGNEGGMGAMYEAKLNMVMAQLERAQLELERIMAGDDLVLDHFGDGTSRTTVRSNRQPLSPNNRGTTMAITGPPSSPSMLPPRPAPASSRPAMSLAGRRSRSAATRSASPGELSTIPASDMGASDTPTAASRKRRGVNPKAVAAVENFFGVRNRGSSPSPARQRSRSVGSTSTAADSVTVPSFTSPSAPYTIPSPGRARSRSPTGREDLPITLETRSYYIDPRTGQVMNSLNGVSHQLVEAPPAEDQPPRPLGVVMYYRDPETGKELTQAEMKERWGFTLE